jgi:internalin A
MRCNNLIIVLPVLFLALSNLEELDLSLNQLFDLPPEIGALADVLELLLGDNPLVTPPPEVVAQGAMAILAYLREFSKDAQPLSEAKIVLVGEGAVGKTTLKERLIPPRRAA